MIQILHIEIFCMNQKNFIFYICICNAAMVRTTGFESFSIFILDCWSIINSIVNDDILNLCLLWLCSGARHSLCVEHFSSYTLAFWLDQQNCFK